MQPRPHDLGTILIGTDAKDPTPNVTAVITGANIGDEKVLTCISDKAKEKSGEAPSRSPMRAARRSSR